MSICQNFHFHLGVKQGPEEADIGGKSGPWRSPKMHPEKGQKRRSFKQRLVLKSSLAKETLSEFLGTFIMLVSIS